MTKCKRMKEGGEHIGSVRNDVLEKWNSMSDAEKEPYIAQSKMDSEEYKEWRKSHENKDVSTMCNIKRVNSLIIHLKEKVSAYERNGVARIRAWGKEEVVRVMAKLKLDGPRKQERVIGKDVIEAVEPEEKEEEMVVLGDDGEGKHSKFDIFMSELANIKKIQFDIMQRQSRVEETLERHKGEVEGKIDGVVKEVEGGKLKGEIKEMKSYVDQKYDELKKYEEEKREEEEKMEEMRRKDVDVIYTAESVIDADLDSECPAPHKKKHKVEKANIPSGIDDIEVAISTGVGCQQQSVESIATFWGPILGNYMKFTDCEKMKILDSYNKKCNWEKEYGSLGKFPLKNFKFVEHKKNERLNGYDCGMYVMMWIESIGSTGATGDFVGGEWDRSRILNDLVSHNQNQRRQEITKSAMRHKNNKTSTPKMALKCQRQKRGLSQSSSQPRFSQPQPSSQTIASSEEIRSFETLNFRSDTEKERWQTSFKVRKIRPERVIDMDVDNQEVNEDEDDDDDDDDDDPNKYIVSATPPARKLIIFYVNGVLAYIPRQPKDVVLRTGLYEFMHFCIDNFIVVIWFSKMRHNIDPVLEKLPLMSDHFLFTWDQANCKTYDNDTYCKDLNDVWNVFPYFNNLNTLMVDDSREKMIYNPKYNYICPHSFDDASHSGDNDLEKGSNIREYLENLLKAPNIPGFVRNNPFSSD
ncbi:hypothetical protein F3Y22_tig00111582pilonHSYRG00175 [Hibiscus syriacus]|uniref:FCP1 homology domain-containing protein n=1 Tax=Hibiscus syriacus TaxID=106335 RepID=A0A6A2XM59_HIBSY|nr:hypothetical protein F3Y22_tig00111582pilonHSYRG00175 [Hibiscus syriacus]